MIKYDVFDDYGNAGSQCRSTGMTKREHWHDGRRDYLDDKKRANGITPLSHLGDGGTGITPLLTDKTVSLICPTTIGIWYEISKEDCRY
ncbi:MAG: hypothetical protein ACEY3A_04550 [Wolbachia sp.]